MKPFLDVLVESTKENETPERYVWWAGLSAIAAVIGKRVWMQRGPFYKLYPNIYVAIVSARSGLRKGIPISIAKGLVKELDKVRVISGCNSIQALIQELSQQKTFKSGVVVSEAQGLLVSDEFESFLTEDPRALTYLTALHNTHEHEESWEKHVKSSPLEHLKSPCLSLLVASNEALFEAVVKAKDIKGGFIARTFIVHESRKKRRNDLIYSDEKLIELIEQDKLFNIDLTARLRQINMLTGPFKWSILASKYYSEWYEELCNLVESQEDITGSLDRLGDQVIKCAMLVALSSHNELIIQKEDLVKAIDESERCLQGVQAISMEKENGDMNPVIEKILKTLIKSPDQEITRKKLLISTHIDSMLLDRALETLIQRGAIDDPKRNSKREVFYKMRKEVFDKYMNFKIAEGGIN